MILGQSVTPCEGELSVKSYQCTEFNSKLFGIKAKGYLEVTNRRLLFQAYGKAVTGWSIIHNEVAIGDVSEIKIYKGSSFNLRLFIFGIIFSIIIGAILSLLMEGESGTILALLVVAGVAFWLYNTCRKQAFSLIVQTKGGSGNVVYIAGLSPFGSGNSIASKALEALPGEDSELLCKEIGAIVLDIQKMGENAIRKWKK